MYALLGEALGGSISVDPTLAVRLRFVHIHINLIGFMTMMVAGVAFRVFPRFNLRKLPWPEGMRYQFILQNAGLLGMVTLHALGGWQGGVAHAAFVFFAILAGIAVAIMFYNFHFVLSAPEETTKPEKITGEMKVAEVLDYFLQALSLFLESGFQSLVNPAARQTFAKVVKVEKTCEKHGVNTPEFI